MVCVVLADSFPDAALVSVLDMFIKQDIECT